MDIQKKIHVTQILRLGRSLWASDDAACDDWTFTTLKKRVASPGGGMLMIAKTHPQPGVMRGGGCLWPSSLDTLCPPLPECNAPGWPARGGHAISDRKDTPPNRTLLILQKKTSKNDQNMSGNSWNQDSCETKQRWGLELNIFKNWAYQCKIEQHSAKKPTLWNPWSGSLDRGLYFQHGSQVMDRHLCGKYIIHNIIHKNQGK